MSESSNGALIDFKHRASHLVFVLFPLGIKFLVPLIITYYLDVENAVDILYLLAVLVLVGQLSSMEIFTFYNRWLLHRGASRKLTRQVLSLNFSTIGYRSLFGIIVLFGLLQTSIALEYTVWLFLLLSIPLELAVLEWSRINIFCGYYLRSSAVMAAKSVFFSALVAAIVIHTGDISPVHVSFIFFVSGLFSVFIIKVLNFHFPASSVFRMFGKTSYKTLVFGLKKSYIYFFIGLLGLISPLIDRLFFLKFIPDIQVAAFFVYNVFGALLAILVQALFSTPFQRVLVSNNYKLIFLVRIIAMASSVAVVAGVVGLILLNHFDYLFVKENLRIFSNAELTQIFLSNICVSIGLIFQLALYGKGKDKLIAYFVVPEFLIRMIILWTLSQYLTEFFIQILLFLSLMGLLLRGYIFWSHTR
jgi:hypothetical protein